MYEHKTLHKLEDYFKDLSSRPEKGIYFYRINGYSEAIGAFIRQYYEAARRSGVVIEGKIPNPDEKNLAYYEEIMGLGFQMSMGFLTSSLKKWLPRMTEYQCNQVASAIYDTLEAMRLEGKNENMQKNAYIKFMCWLYYRFERVVGQLGNDKIPKVLYEGEIGSYELKLISVLANAGCDVVLLQYRGDQGYLKLDPDSRLSLSYTSADMKAFPADYSVKRLRQEIEEELRTQKLYGGQPSLRNCTNAWIEGKGLEDMLKGAQVRGTDPSVYYNCFYRINGVEDKLTYLNELYQFQLQLKNNKRRIAIVENMIPPPATDEIASIVRGNYKTQDQMFSILVRNIQYAANMELQKVMVKAFIDIMSEEGKKPDINLNRLMNKGVYLLCWLKRYQQALFSNWRMPEISCMIYLGGCRNENEALFLRMMSRLPVDILILNPNLDSKCCLEDKFLYEKSYENSMAVEKFPQENADIRMGTAAYHAERDLDTLMYNNSGIYRNQQYGKAVAVNLRTMYEEIAILWDQETKYRPNFSVVDGVVNIPVIFAKVSGVKNGQVEQYWSDIKRLVVEDTLLIKSAPFINGMDANPVKSHVTEFFKNGVLQQKKIKAHSAYQYGFLREEMQNHLLDKLQLLIDQKLIRGTFENGMEYTIISTALNLKKNILRMIQKFDFTRKNPKIIYINTSENTIPLEDGIMTAFLNLVGFDVVFFVPTGYQSVERHFNRNILEEHQTGEYLYDLRVPDFDTVPLHARQSWREILFKRGK